MASVRRDVSVRAADPERDRDRVLGVLSRCLPRAAGRARYDWLYLSNPHGPARVWLAEDTATGELVGTSAGHPKRVWANGERLDVLDLSDFAIDPAWRTLGPALKLLRATLEPMQRGEFAFSYDHPSAAMFAIYQRMGGRDVSARRRWVRLLKVGKHVEKRFGPGLRGRLLGHAGDLAVRARDVVTTRGGELAISALGPGDDAAVDRLDEELRRMTPLRLARSAAHVRWRYVRNVIAPHDVLCARRDGAVVGYMVLRPQEPDVLAIVDLMTSDPAAPSALVDAAVRLGHRRGVSALWMTVLRGSPVENLLPQTGFVARGDGPGVVIYAPKVTGPLADTLQDPKQWWMLEGDEDV